MPTDTPPPLAVDYSGLPLTIGDTVAYISHDPIGLSQGRVRLIAPLNICLEDGPHLITFEGVPASFDTRRPRPVSGTVTRNEDAPEPFRYPHVAIQPNPDRFAATEARIRELETDLDHMEENTVGDLNEALINATRAIAERDTDLRRVNAVGAALEYEATGIGLAEPAREAMRDAARRIRAALDQSAEPHNADQPPVREQRERPTHPDGTPYRYHEIKAEGWGYCDGCRMWSTATPERPHQCPQTHMQGPVATSAGIEASSPQERP